MLLGNVTYKDALYTYKLLTYYPVNKIHISQI
jgi:hypothetical protein